MKKLVSLLLSVACVLSLTACGSKAADAADEPRAEQDRAFRLCKRDLPRFRHCGRGRSEVFPGTPDRLLPIGSGRDRRRA